MLVSPSFDPTAFASGELGYSSLKVPEYLSAGRAVVTVPSGHVGLMWKRFRGDLTPFSRSLGAWTDRAAWHGDLHECRWRIEPDFLSDGIRCAGITRYGTALGGRGTRVTFEGTLDVRAARVPGLPALLGDAASGIIEPFLVGMIPKSLRKLGDAVTALLATGG